MINNLFIIFFSIALFSDILIRNKILGNRINFYYFKFLDWSYFSKYFVLFLVLFSIFTCLSYFEIYLIPKNNYVQNFSLELDFNSYMLGDNNKGDSNIIKSSVNDNTVNINNPNVNVNISDSSAKAINNLAGALSSTGGATLAYNVAKHIPGSPGVKLGVGLGTMGAVQAASAVMGKYLNSQSTSNDKKGNQFINNLFSNNDLENKFNEYPLNLLSDIDNLINIELIFMSVIFNIFLANYINHIDFSKYISNNSNWGKNFLFFIERYKNIWSKSSRVLMIYSWFLLFFCIFVTKFCMYIILQT